MEETILNASVRNIVGKQVKALRRAGKLPAVIYGHSIVPINIAINSHEANLLLPTLSSSHLIVVDVDGTRHTTLVREKQTHPVTRNLVHIDFQEVSLTEKLKTGVGIIFVGEAPAAKNYNGVIVTNLEELEVEALPMNLPDHITIDLSILKNIGDTIHIRDIKLSSEVEILSHPDEIVVIVTAPAVEVEITPTEAVSEEPEVIEKGKKEEEEES
jgi:large subunit ribosomal protein L25